jgi:aspartate kinase
MIWFSNIIAASRTLTRIAMPLILQQKPRIVQKYGGTSLGKLLQQITGTIIPQYLQSNNIAVVCSAMSGTSKSFGTTSLLLQAIDHATASTKCHKELNETIDTIKGQHLEASKHLQAQDGVGGYREVFEELDAGIVKDCEKLRSFLFAAQVSRSPKYRI